MSYSTGNENDPGRGPLGLPAMPDLIYPDLKWADSDYAHLKVRLDFYTDMICLSQFEAGQVTSQYLVDPAEVAAALGGIELGSGLLPAGCLFWSKLAGTDRLGIWAPARIWSVAVQGQEPAWQVPMPDLVLIGHDYDYQLWAVVEPPLTRSVQLYLAPCPNIDLKGVCQGSVPFPRAEPATIWPALETFFSSRFNEDLANQKSKEHPTSVLAQWRALAEAGADEYPVADLVGTNLTLGRLIDAPF